MAFRPFSGSSGAPDWLAVFLGNPGSRYDRTRHNMGFLAADCLAEALDIKINRVRFQGFTAQAAVEGHKVLLLKPQTYMNLSGESVRAAADFYKIAPSRVIVVLDDMNIPAGRLRIRPSGSSGGHKGLQNIIDMMHTDLIPRVRIGVGKPDNPEFDVIDWVISRMSDEELRSMLPSIKRAGDAVCEMITNGIESAMDKYNRAQ